MTTQYKDMEKKLLNEIDKLDGEVKGYEGNIH